MAKRLMISPSSVKCIINYLVGKRISPTKQCPPVHHFSPMIEETKFNIYGEMFHSNGFSRMDILSYIAPTQEEAIANCKRNNPGFHVMSCWVDDSKPEVVRMQSLI